MYVDLIEHETAAVSFETSRFHDDWRGVIELRLKSEKARKFRDALVGLGARSGKAFDDETD